MTMNTFPNMSLEEESRIACPCEKYTALSKIVDVLDSEGAMRSLLEWLDGSFDEISLEEDKLLSCGKRSRCRFRYGISFAILNAIRDACRPFLEASSSPNGADGNSGVVEEGCSTPSSNPPSAITITYEEDFPSLGSLKPSTIPKPHPAASNILVPRKKQSAQDREIASGQPNTLLSTKKNGKKRRIRPVQVLEPVDKGPENSVWNAQTTSTMTSNPWGNFNGNNPSRWTSKDLAPAPAFSQVEAAIPSSTTPTKATASTASAYATTPENSKTYTVEPQMVTPNAKTLETNSSTSVEQAAPHHLNNLVTIYIALFRNMLVPSTPLELHFLIRLLVVEGKGQSGGSEAPVRNAVFQSIFADASSCQRFATSALAQLKNTLTNLPPSLLGSLLQCESFQRHCPQTAETINGVLEEYIRQGLTIDYPAEAVTGTHAILTLPFDRERDSRHNYKTQAELAVYKNREESRDAFMRELRGFMNVRGKVLRPKDMDRAQERVRQESKNIMNGLMSVNMMWFAQFYCELLLQVGLAPVQETDQELLNIADRDKLQKLHKRFSSRSTQTNKSSKRISISQNSKSSSATPLDEAKLSFPGYQEFFFLFLHQLSFNFGFHLRGRMAKTILDLLAALSPADMEQKIMKLQLAARFLGFLVFSPNWHEACIDSSKIQSIALADGMQQLDSLGLSLVEQLESAWRSGQVIAGVPWMTELLRMAKWDSLTQTSKQFRQLLANLRAIQSRIASGDIATSDDSSCGPSMEIVAIFLERFFHETSGLPRLTSLPLPTLSVFRNGLSDCLDSTSTVFSTALIFAASSHLEDLISLIEEIGRGLRGKTPAKSKKLRPSILSRNVGLEPSKLFEDPQTDNGRLATPVKQGNSILDGNLNPIEKETNSVETKLVEAFFHQHRDIKLICDFIVDQTLKVGPKQIVADCLGYALEEEQISADLAGEEFSNVQTLTLAKATATLQSRLRSSVESGLEMFGPADTPSRVLTVAAHLSVSRGMVSAKAILPSVVSDEIASYTTRRSPFGAAITEKVVSPVEDGIALGLSAIEELILYFDGRGPLDAPAQAVLVLLRRASSCLVEQASSSQISIPPESDLRSIASAILRLDRLSYRFLPWCRSLPDSDYYELFSAVLHLLIAASTVSSIGLKEWAKAIDEELMLRLVETSVKVDGGPNEVNKLLQDLDDGAIIDLRPLIENDALDKLETDDMDAKVNK